MRTMFYAMYRHLMAGEPLVLVTITAATGATPRGTGARMLVGANGRICGTIGGGAVEYRSEQTALEVLREGRSARRDFSLTREDVQDLGMICGGAVQVFFHHIPAGDAGTLALAERAQALYEGGDAVWLLSRIDGDGTLSLYTRQQGVFGSPVPRWVLERLGGKPGVVEQDGQQFCVEQIFRPGRVYLFGGGHVSRELEPVLSHVGFRCVVLDDRPEFVRREHFPTAEDVRLVDFSDIRKTVSIGPEDYVCILTRGHAYDTVIQAQVLKCRPAYVGVIGSRKKAAAVRQKLKTEFGLSEEELDQITTPIGLDIAAETPAEIAISIAAQMIHHRATRM